MTLFLAILGAAGAFLIVDGLVGLIPRSRRATGGLDSAVRARGQDVESNRVTILEEVPLLDRMISPLLQDLAGRLDERKREELAARLRRSGWKYRTVPDFYATRVALAAMFFLGGAGFLIISGSTAFFWVPLALGLLGYFLPDQEVRSAINERRQAVLAEMAFSLDRLGLLLKAGIALPEAIGTLAEVPGGPFIAALRRAARRIGAGGVQAIDEALEGLVADLPEDPEVSQFVARVKSGMAGTPIAESLNMQAARLRAALNARLLERGLKTVLVITTVGGIFMLPALGILILGPVVVLAFNVL